MMMVLDLCIVKNKRYFFFFLDYLKILNNTYIFVYILSIHIIIYQNQRNLL